MSRARVTVALPIRDGAATLPEVLASVREQQVEHEVELLVCDSGSHDDSVAVARAHGARVLHIAPNEFAHGPVRNLLMREACGDFVALLTQDAMPADGLWLAALLAGFDVAEDVALVYGPYCPRAGADQQTARELRRWFDSLSPDGRARVDRLEIGERDLAAAVLFGRRTFFTDANACVRREAWEHVPFRAVAYAEDQALALDMLRAGYAKVYAPDAPVLHSHDYTLTQQFRRAFDEWRGLYEIYGWREPGDPRRIFNQLRGELGAQRRELLASELSATQRHSTLARATRHHVVRMAGALLGSRADHLPAQLRRWCSLERRAGVVVPDPRLLLADAHEPHPH